MEYTAAVEQLEQERQEASKRSQRLQEKLKELQKERDSALKKASEYKARLVEAKESDKSEVVALQDKLAKVAIKLFFIVVSCYNCYISRRQTKSILPKWKNYVSDMLKP